MQESAWLTQRLRKRRQTRNGAVKSGLDGGIYEETERFLTESNAPRSAAVTSDGPESTDTHDQANGKAG